MVYLLISVSWDPSLVYNHLCKYKYLVLIGEWLKIHSCVSLEFEGLFVECGRMLKPEHNQSIRYQCRLLDGSNKQLKVRAANLIRAGPCSAAERLESQRLTHEGQELFFEAMSVNQESQINALIFKAKSRYQTALSLNFGSVITHAALADCYAFLGDEESTALCLKRACANCTSGNLPRYLFAYANSLGVYWFIWIITTYLHLSKRKWLNLPLFNNWYLNCTICCKLFSLYYWIPL